MQKRTNCFGFYFDISFRMLAGSFLLLANTVVFAADTQPQSPQPPLLKTARPPVKRPPFLFELDPEFSAAEAGGPAAPSPINKELEDILLIVAPKEYQACDTVLGKRTRTPFPTKLNLQGYSPGPDLGKGQFKAVRSMGPQTSGSPHYAFYAINGIANEINLLELPKSDARKKTYARMLYDASILHKFVKIPHFVQSHGLVCVEEGAGSYSILHVMDLYGGGTLADWLEALKKSGGLDGHQAINLAASLCEALQVMHAKNVAHRDLKPDNIFLDDEHNLYIGDFGQAYSLEELQKEENIEFRNLQGTPVFTHSDYAKKFHKADEGAARLAIAQKNDYWSMGLILLHALSGEKRRSWLKALPKGEAASAWGDATVVTLPQINAEIGHILDGASKLSAADKSKLNNLLHVLLKAKLQRINELQITSACHALK